MVQVIPFEIIIQKKDDEIELECIKGCAWKKLTFSNKNSDINELGMANNSDLKSSKFYFNLKRGNDKIYLIGNKGSAWNRLSFSINKDQKIKINQLGMVE
ncbi:hypothetical protein [Polaribacter cellanae]|uniref:Uncharacterized protein n=1 Tax=Polaribacter cellanae TaxID=2818493 RepID=A0A975CRS5_9FLAO|nr:hypothetical protein [Polaribacter cellanae]QTE22061.1 hypothetical protein J3359_14770 [Polaribacter cellanae]